MPQIVYPYAGDAQGSKIALQRICPGWKFYGTCTHAAAVTRRLEREGKAQRAKKRTPAPVADMPVETRSRRDQLFPERY